MPTGQSPNGVRQHDPNYSADGKSSIPGIIVNGVDANSPATSDTTPNVVAQGSAFGLRCQVAGASIDMPIITGPLSINAVCKAASRSTSSTLIERDHVSHPCHRKRPPDGSAHGSPAAKASPSNSSVDQSTKSRPIRVCVATCNRADYSKLAPVIGALQADPAFELSIIVSGSHLLDDYGLTFRMLIEDGFNPDARLHTIVRGEDEAAMVESVGLSMIKLPDVLTRLQPDILLFHGDRFDVLAYAGAAALMNIRTVHMEGGEVSGTIDDCLRHAITKLAHFHVVSNDMSKRRLLAMGEEEERILVAGCPSYDSLLTTNMSVCQEAIDNWIGKGFRGRDFIIAIQHPVTTALTESIAHFEMLLDALLRFEKRTLLLMPNVDAGSKELTRIARCKGVNPGAHEFIIPVKHVPFHQFVLLLANAGLVVGNSSSGVREAGAFGTPVVNLGTRQMGRESASNVLHVTKPISTDEVLEAMKKHYRKDFPRSFIYGDGHAVPRIIRFLKRVNVNGSIQKTFDFSACTKLLRPRLSSLSALKELDHAFRGMNKSGSQTPEPLIHSDVQADLEAAVAAMAEEEESRDGPVMSSTPMVPKPEGALEVAPPKIAAKTAAKVTTTMRTDNEVEEESDSRGDWDPISHVVSVDLGGTRLRVALVSTKGAIVKNLIASTPEDPVERVRVIVDHVISVLSYARDAELRVLGVGISTGGRVDVVGGRILDATSLLKGWTGVELVQTLKKAVSAAGFTGMGKGSEPPSPTSTFYQLPVLVDNDGNCAALGESRWGGAGASGESMVVIATGTGIGGGVISEKGDVVRGSGYCGGELGHMIVAATTNEEDGGGGVCSCGSRGCLEAVASGSALTTEAEKLISGGDLRIVDSGTPGAKALIEAATEGNEKAKRVVDRATAAMSVACLNLLHILNPRHLVFTGHLAQVMVEPVKRFVNQRALKNARNVEIYASKLENPSLMGAASLVMESCQVAWMGKKAVA